MDSDRLRMIVDIHSTCGKIARRFGRIFSQSPERAFKYLERMVREQKLTQKGFDRAKEYYDHKTVHEGD